MRPVAQHHLGVARRQRAQLADPVHPDDGRPVDARELRRVEPGLQLFQRLPVQVRGAAGVDLDVVVLRLDPVDLVFAQESGPRAVAERDGAALGRGRRAGRE